MSDWNVLTATIAYYKAENIKTGVLFAGSLKDFNDQSGEPPVVIEEGKEGQALQLSLDDEIAATVFSST
jgi:hypothetical protein